MLAPWDSPAVTEPDHDRPWHRQPFDSDVTWYAFRYYLERPLPRKLVDIAKLIQQPHTIVQQWHDANKWEARCGAYDNYVHDRYREELNVVIVERARESADKYVELIEDILEVGSLEAKKLLKAARENQIHGLVKPRDLVRLVEAMVKLRLLLGGDATERIEIGAIDEAVKELDYAEITQLRSLQTKLLKKGRKDE